MAWRTTSTILVLSLIAAVAATPGAAAATTLPTCTDVTDPNAVPSDGAVYVDVVGTTAEVWEEANGVDGLQKEACETSDGTTVDADAHTTTVDAVGTAEDVAAILLGLVPDPQDLPCFNTPFGYWCIF